MNSTRAMLARACAGKKTNLKAALLDQRVVAGLGNIYVCEALHRSQLSPRSVGLDAGDSATRRRPITPSGWSAPFTACSTPAIEAGGSSLRDHRRTDGELGYFQHSFRVYDREEQKCPTAKCGGIIKRFTPERAFDVLVPEVPEVMVSRSPILRTRAARIRGRWRCRTRLPIPAHRPVALAGGLRECWHPVRAGRAACAESSAPRYRMRLVQIACRPSIRCVRSRPRNR